MIFRPNFARGGRLYSRGAFGYQALSKKQRRRITVDGEPVAELDFSGYQPRLLYHRMGMDFPKEFDIYMPEMIFPAVYETEFFSEDTRLNGFGGG